jgi:multicomponent Na+:H+ antiporter subunit D
MQDMASILPNAMQFKTVETGFAFIIIGIALKLALFPLHLWLPNAYTYAPSVVTVFLAATATKVAVYVMLRILFTIAPNDFTLMSSAEDLFIVLGIAGIIIASLHAIYQKDVKRLLAYSSVAQIGYMALGIGFATAAGVMATLIHLFNHALMKGALFMAIGAIIYRIGVCRIEQIHGLGRAMPWTFGTIIIGGMSLVGVPGTAGFISKWYLIVAALEREAWISVAAILIGSLLAVVYVGKLIEALYFKPMTDTSSSVTEAPMLLLLPTWGLVLANIYFGLDTSLTVGIAKKAAAILMAVNP